MSDDTIRVSRKDLVELLLLWPSMLPADEGAEALANRNIDLIAHNNAALIAATPQEPDPLVCPVCGNQDLDHDSPACVRAQELKHGCIVHGCKRGAWYCDIHADIHVPQKPKRRFIRPAAINAEVARRFGSVPDVVEKNALGNGFFQGIAWALGEYGVDPTEASESGEQPCSEGFAGCSCGRGYGHASNCNALGGD